MNTVKDTTTATLMAIMGRDSAYTGNEIAWDGLLASTARLGPQQYAMGPVTIKATPPVPGVEPGPPAP
jgi:myo-inositol 2-dehydrogenase / D-chiro-inositol 1-dehydrogenase